MSVASTFPAPSRFSQFYVLTKPRVVQLIVFCALIGMVLAVPGLPTLAQLGQMALASAGVWLVAGAAAAFNCIVEQGIDAKMKRTSWRPTAKGELSNTQTLLFSALLCAAGSALLYVWVNPLTMWLTFATFVGYAVVYTVILKPLTPQNIVIGGASGAMPPVLGWAAMTGDVGPEALILFLIIFLWTPPHFWALSLFANSDYKRANIPMMTVTAGAVSTKRQMLAYTLVLFPVAMLPFVLGYAGMLYGICAAAPGGFFIFTAVKTLYDESERNARRMFAYSVFYLFAIFLALMIDAVA